MGPIEKQTQPGPANHAQGLLQEGSRAETFAENRDFQESSDVQLSAAPPSIGDPERDVTVAEDAVQRVESGADPAAHLSDGALKAFTRLESNDPVAFARLVERLRNTKVSFQLWKQTLKATKVADRKRQFQEQEKKFEETGIAIDPEKRRIQQFNENLFAAHVTRKFDLGVDVVREKVFRYTDGVWRSMGELELLRMVRDYLHQIVPNSWSLKCEQGYFPALLREAEHIDQLDANRDFVNLSNGMLNLDTMQLEPHAKKFYSSIRVDINFVPEADCHRFLEFLSEILDADAERVALVQEMFGYCLTAEVKAQKAFLLYGAGGNGKSVLLDVLTALVGKENCSAVPLAELENDFARSDLFGKTVNLVTENEVDPKGINTTYFKAIVSGELVRANVKYEKAFTFRSTAKLVFAANNLPYSRDRSSGFLRRLIVIPFNRQFLGSKATKELTNQLLEELPGVLNWAIEGLRRLRSNGYVFTQSEAVEGALDEFRANLSPVFAFVSECFTVNPIGRASRKSVREAYKRWCRLNGHESAGGMTTKKFWEAFRTACREKRIGIVDDKTTRSNGIDFVAGLDLKPERKWGEREERPASPEMEALFRAEDDESDGRQRMEEVSKHRDSCSGAEETQEETMFVDAWDEELRDVQETFLYLAAKASNPFLTNERWQEVWDGDLSQCPALEVTTMGNYQLVCPGKTS